jgi:phage repressor protein C with HTH and peptisase S24 domain
MDPTLPDGDIVDCDGGGWDGDGIYVIKSAEKAFVKRVVFTPDGGILGPGQQDGLSDDGPPAALERTGEIPLIYTGDERLKRGIVIPFLEDQAVPAGYGTELAEGDNPTRYLRAPEYLAKYPNLAMLPIRGDSMDPALHDGDIVVCDGGGWDGDGIYVLKTSENAFVKRVVSTSKGYQVVSDNQAYPSYGESKEDVTIVGKVRAAMIMIPGRRGGI